MGDMVRFSEGATAPIPGLRVTDVAFDTDQVIAQEVPGVIG